MKIVQYQPKKPEDIKKAFNNIYVKNYPSEWNEANLKDLFGKYGDIKSLQQLTRPARETHPQRNFAFICYDRDGDRTYGPACAEAAVKDLHEAELEGGLKLYVQPAIPKAVREAIVKSEITRFKNSKKKCNLFVKNFPQGYTKENLHELFSPFGVIESIVLGPKNDDATEGRPSFAFVCFAQPDSAQNARAFLHQKQFQGRNLYVTNYELPEIRQKTQRDARDKADFYSQ